MFKNKNSKVNKPEKVAKKMRKARSPGKSGMRARALAALLSLAASVAISFVFLPALYDKRALTENVLVAAGDISRGDIILDGRLTRKEVGVYGHEGYYTDKGLVVGMVAVSDIAAGDIITESKLGAAEDNALLTLPADGRGLITITVRSNAAGLSSHLTRGATVNVYNVTPMEETIQQINSFGAPVATTVTRQVPVLNPILRNMEVFSVENADTRPLREDEETEDGQAASSNVVSTITFFTDSTEQETELLRAEYDGVIHVSLVKQ